MGIIEVVREHILAEVREEGREEGRQELLDVSIKALDRAGLPAAQIAEYLGLSIEAVESRLAGWRGENNA